MAWQKSPGSLRKRMSRAQMILVILMLIPALLSVSLLWWVSQDYHNVIERIDSISALRPVIQNELLNEVMDVVTGRKRFNEGNQYHILHRAKGSLDVLINNRAASSIELEVSRRILGTLESYVDTLGVTSTVDEQMAINDEINNVSILFLDMLQDAVNAEIKASAEKSTQIQFMVNTLIALELCLLIISLLFALLTQRSLSNAIRIPLSKLQNFAGRIAGGSLSERAEQTDVEELQALTQSLNIMAFKLERLMEENRKEQENLKKSELRALQAQITPHFLYNTLDAIVWLAESGRSQQVIEITSALSNFFRISLNNGKDWVSIGEEWEHLEGYLTIQKIRYRDILRYELVIDDSLKQYKMLKLLIQPLVENAIYHGIKNRRSGGTVCVEAKQLDTHLQVAVMDSGIGMDTERLSELEKALTASESTEAETGYGLYSVDRRIKLYYNQQQGLSISSVPGEGTTVKFCVPLRS